MSFTEAVALVNALPTDRHGDIYHRTYQPDAQACAVGHLLHSEADCLLPEGWDNFLCRRCLQICGDLFGCAEFTEGTR